MSNHQRMNCIISNLFRFTTKLMSRPACNGFTFNANPRWKRKGHPSDDISFNDSNSGCLSHDIQCRFATLLLYIKIRPIGCWYLTLCVYDFICFSFSAFSRWGEWERGSSGDLSLWLRLGNYLWRPLGWFRRSGRLCHVGIWHWCSLREFDIWRRLWWYFYG